MALKKTIIALPKLEHFFSYKLSIEICHINYGNHLAHDSVLSIMHETRIQFLKSLQLSEINVNANLTEKKVGLILGEVQVQYKAEAFHGEILHSDVLPYTPEGARWPVVQRLTRPLDGVEIARAFFVFSFYDYEMRKVSRAPHTLLEKAEQLKWPIFE